MTAVSVRREVLRLYKRLLRLHERLPGDFATLGQRFVREEFKKHKSVSQEQAKMFTKEWTVSHYHQSMYMIIPSHLTGLYAVRFMLLIV